MRGGDKAPPRNPEEITMQVNGIQCDTYAYVDDKVAGETVIFDLNKREDHTIIVYLYENGEPFPVSNTLTAECCINDLSIGGNVKSTILATIGNNGEIVIEIPESLRTDGKNLLCEINISGTDELNENFRYKSTNFRVAIID